MLVENLSYLATFVATTGIAVIGALVAHQLFQESKKPLFQILLYQQIFLFSFFLYGIWGNLALRQVIADVNISSELAGKLAFFIPLPGIPFLIVSWFMLVKFSFNLNGYRGYKKLVYLYFAGSVFLLATFAFLFQNNYLHTPLQPDVFIIRLFVATNLCFHLLYILPFLKPQKRTFIIFKKGQLSKCLLLYPGGVGLYSVMWWFYGNVGFVFTVLSILLLFTVSALLPVCLKFMAYSTGEKTGTSDKSFQSFCKDFEISKREAEIILEICTGKTNKAIAEKLFITLQTVKDHTHRIYTKTRVKGRVQLTNLVRERVNAE